MPLVRNNDQDYLGVGYLKKLHGIKGELEIDLGEEKFLDLLDRKGWIFVEINGEFIPFHIISYYQKNPVTIVIALDDIYSYEQAEGLLKHDVYVAIDSEVEKQEFLPQDEYYEQFIGYKGITVAGVELGSLTGVEKSSVNPLLVFEGEKKVMVPIFADFIKEVNTDQKEILLDLPAGFLEVF
jgi:16S rRNA processing protein RimM